MRWISLVVVFFICLAPGARGADTNKAEVVDPLGQYNVVWKTPSKNHNGSMPIGNGDIGMNVWAQPGGELLLLLSKTDAWSENCRLLKLGRVRITLSPDPFAKGLPFEQSLRLRQGDIRINAGRGERAVELLIWVDANRPVIHVEAESPSDFDMQVDLDVWRTKRRQLKGKEVHSAYGLHGAPFPVYVYPDVVFEGWKDKTVWYHRNGKSIWEGNLKHQGMEGFIDQAKDPLLNLTFGGCIEGDGLTAVNSTRLKTAEPRRRLALSIHPLTAQTPSIDGWLDRLKRNVDKHDAAEIQKDRSEHQAWWNGFWNRSWIRIKGSDDVEAVTRGYTLQRWISACAGRGRYPIKFNGTIFTVQGAGFDPDYRRWGGPYWWQNTRLPYWPMLAAGDFEMMSPLFRMYKDTLDLAEHRTKVWFGHDGAFIGETVYFWGMYNNNNYGWKRSDKLPVGELTNRYIRREYTASPELMAMMLDYYAYTDDDEFLKETLLPMSDSLLEFWDEHYDLDEDGRMKIYPAQALETLQNAANPTTDIAGLRWVLGGLLELPEERAGAERRAFWKRLLKKVPPLPTAEVNGKKCILGAEKVFGGRGNSENPEMYAVFPFRLYGMGKPGLDVGRVTFARRRVKGNNGWRQDDTQAALLGLTDVAAKYIVGRAKNKHGASRFPAFWGPNFDWIPDQDHGGNLMMGLEAMLIQTDGDRILLLPAWPEDWDVDFRLHAPHRTVVEGAVRAGEVTRLNVTPAERREDVTIMLKKQN